MKKIKLTQGKYALVDDEDFEFLNQWKWCAQIGRCNWYAIRKKHLKWDNNKKISIGKTIRMHRLIVKNISKGMQVDHKNGNGLDNRKENLRICTIADNCKNRGKTKFNVSGYKGVYKMGNRWRAHIGFLYKIINLGYFNTAKEGALAYNEAAKKYHGKFAYLNKI